MKRTEDGYRCANCHQWFTYADDWTEEEVAAEAKANGFDLDDDMVVVCDDCYKAMGLLQAMLPPGSLS